MTARRKVYASMRKAALVEAALLMERLGCQMAIAINTCGIPMTPREHVYLEELQRQWDDYQTLTLAALSKRGLVRATREAKI